VDIGGIDGLLHVREMAWGRVEHPDHVVKKGQKLQVLILDIDEEKKRIALGLKQLQSDPWKKAAKSYRTGQMVNGKITHIAPSCAFVELEDGIEAIIPISEMSEERIKTPDEVVKVGQQVEARIKTVQPNQRKITLSLRAAVREKERKETREAIRDVNQRATGGDSGPVRLGDIFGEQLREARERTKDRKKNRDDAKTRAQRMAEEEEWDGEPLPEDDAAVAVVGEEEDTDTALNDDVADQPETAEAGEDTKAEDTVADETNQPVAENADANAAVADTAVADGDAAEANGAESGSDETEDAEETQPS
jgi:predicted RNA-binding protein with RPS1 domain